MGGGGIGWMGGLALGSAGLAAVILVMHLVRRPRFVPNTKLWLLMGLGIFPIASAGAAGPQCEATTLTEYQQRNNVARVTGTVSIASCPAGTTGSFTLVARVRDDNGETRPIEFNETWQRNDAEDHAFNTEYPIGDNVELMSVRVRNLKCTCAAAAQ